MARYVTSVRSPLSPEAAFAYMADLRHFAEWDPGVRAVEQVVGDGGADGAEFAVTVAGPGRDLLLRYKITEFHPSHELVAVATTKTLRSTDRITVRAAGNDPAEGSVVTYDADLRLLGALKFFDLGLRLVFGRIGDRAAAGLRRVLDGTEVAA